MKTPNNQPQDYDERRVVPLKPIRAAIVQLGLPLLSMRKLNGIMGALEMQIEYGGDSPQVKALLVEALHKASRLHGGCAWKRRQRRTRRVSGF